MMILSIAILDAFFDDLFHKSILDLKTQDFFCLL